MKLRFLMKGRQEETPVEKAKKLFLSLSQTNPMLKAAVEIMSEVSRYGTIYIVGGAVRDMVMGKTDIHDVDLATNVPMKTLEKLYPSHDIGKNKEFGIIVVRKGNFDFEIAQFRSEEGYSDGRHPDKVKRVKDFKKDAERRDFTINAMAMDAKGTIIDHFGGVNDIRDKIIRAVGNADERLKEDGVRSLRAIRFAARDGFEIHQETQTAISNAKGILSKVAPERIFKEILSMASKSGAVFASAIEHANKLGLLPIIFPEVEALKTLQHSEETHPEGGVYQHVLAALRCNKDPNPLLNLAILFHDVGKSTTLKTNEKGQPTYHGHDKAGLPIIDSMAARLKLSNEQKEAIGFCAENHMKVHDFLILSPAKAMALIKNKNWDLLYAVSRCDDQCRGNNEKFTNQWNLVDALIEKYKGKMSTTMSDANIKAAINGNVIMRLRNIKTGPEVGRIHDKTYQWMVDNSIDPKDSRAIENFILTA